MTDTQTPLKIPSIAQPIAICTGCGGSLFANVFHVCAFNAHMYKSAFSEDELKKLIADSYVAPPPAPSDAGWDTHPPEVKVETNRTHCKCGTELKPDVAHHCHANQQWNPPAVSHTEITEGCPDCPGRGMLIVRQHGAGPQSDTRYVVVCLNCKTFLGPEVPNRGDAIATWNQNAQSGKNGCWPKWRADLPQDDERQNVGASSGRPAAAHPDLSAYTGVCPVTHVDGKTCVLCEGSGTVPPPAKEVAP